MTDPICRVLFCLFATAIAASLYVGISWAGNGQQTGRIEGRVTTSDGEPRAGVTVSLSGERLPRERTAVTNRSGRFRFAALPPGLYDLSAATGAYGTATAFDIEVQIAESRTVLLQLTEVGAEVILLEDSPTDTRRATVSHRVKRKMFAQLPIRRTSFGSLLQLLPGTAEEQTNGFLTIGGGSWVDNQLIIDGVNYSDPLTNSLFTRFDFYAVEEAEVLSGGLEAEYGEAMGGVVNIITRSGGDTHALGGHIGISPGLLSAAPGEDTLAGRYDINFNAGGPIAKNRAKYFTNISYQRVFDPGPQRDELDIADGRTSNRTMGFAKISWEPSRGHKLSVHTAGFFEQYDDFVLDEVVLKEAQEIVRVGGVTAQLNYHWLFPSGAVEASVGGYYYDSQNRPSSGDIDTPAIVDQSTGVVSGNALELFRNRNMRTQLQVNGTRYVDWLGSHEFKVGAELGLMSIRYDTSYAGNEIVYTNGDECDPEQAIFDGCVRAERTGTVNEDGTLTPGGFVAEATGIKAALYARDSWKMPHGFRLNPGWRMDIGRVTAQTGETMGRFNGFFGPRLGLTWDIGERGSTVVRMSGSRYYQTGMLALPLFFGPSIRRDSHRFNPLTKQFDIYESQSSSGGDTGGEIDLARSKTPPHTDEAVFGVQQALSSRMVVSVTGIYRRSTHLYDSLEENLVWNEVGDSIIAFRDGTPEARYRLYTSEDLFREYAGLEFTLKGQFSEQGFVMASYLLSRLYGTSDLDEVTDANNVVPYVAANPRQRQYLYGPLKGDRRHVAKFALIYRLPMAPFTVGTTFHASTGTPYSRLYYNSYLNGYYDRRAPRGIDPGELNDATDDIALRTDTLLSLSLSGSLDLSAWTGIDRLSLDVQARNILGGDAAIKVEERNVAADDNGDGGFGSTLVAQSPFRLNIGLSFRY